MSDEDEMSEEEMFIIPDEIEFKLGSPLMENYTDKSRQTYQKRYNDFINWQQTSNNVSFDEDTLLTYFHEISENKNSASLYAKYSMLKTMLNVEKNVDIDKYERLKAFLKEKHGGYKAKKAQVFSLNDVSRFLTEAPDHIYLAEKVALIIGVTGACRREELRALKIENLRFENSILIISIPNTRTRVARTFVIEGEYFNIIDKYVKLRPPYAPPNLFLYVKNDQCTNQPIGKNKMGTIPKEIATWLGLPSAEKYNGHTYRSTSKTLLSNFGASTAVIKRNGRLMPVVDNFRNKRIKYNQFNTYEDNQSNYGNSSYLDRTQRAEDPLGNGASTAEAQTRVAVEIAEHFLTLSGRTDEFPITGIVNAPSLVAANNPTNAPWVDLARKLGIIASKFIGSKNRNIVVDYCVCGGEDKKYVKTALLLGLLTGRVKGELNLINAQNLADELKIKVNEQSWSDCENVLFVKAGGHEVKGSLACDSSKLMSVDNTQFKDYVCLLQDNISLYKTKTPEDLTKIVSSHINKSVTISSVSVSGNWVVMQTNNPVTIPIDGIESY
ncbi:uncharacterized protein LOC106645125 isoform X1 [Copidosoma floridanum]|uniref:uncharacterized protein LOC106645125 isoform X1 n=1 Tax=Copidosoma floridanum TaxID=29053 RepID=UPI0006C9B260|nr:uncharacterized protein LOC106645125 isoform X1 [Copidosoma floridanum]